MWVNYIMIYFSFILFLGNSPRGQTCRQIFKLDGSNDVNSRRGVLLGVALILFPHCRVKSPKTSILWA